MLKTISKQERLKSIRSIPIESLMSRALNHMFAVHDRRSGSLQKMALRKRLAPNGPCRKACRRDTADTGIEPCQSWHRPTTSSKLVVPCVRVKCSLSREILHESASRRKLFLGKNGRNRIFTRAPRSGWSSGSADEQLDDQRTRDPENQHSPSLALIHHGQAPASHSEAMETC